LGKFRDLTGMKFGRLTVVKKVGNNKHNQILWECECDCKNIIIVSGNKLTTNNTQSCGCLQKERASAANKKIYEEDFVGKSFGLLTVIEKINKNDGYTYWKCICECNKEIIMRHSNLIKAKSCGCLKKEHMKKISQNNRKHNIYDLESKKFGIGFTSKNEKFYFDKENFELISKYYWNINKDGYIYTRDNGYIIFMHRLVMNAQNNEQIDHVKHELYDNRKNELRIVTQSQNNMNYEIRKDNTSGYRGIYWNKKFSKWHVQISKNKNRYHLGYYDDIIQAIQIRDQFEEKLFGEYSYKNSMGLNDYYHIEDNVRNK
jgi:hypothetical protein